MKKFKYIFTKLSMVLAIAGLCYSTAQASSHREAPMISTDPLADNTDLYAFRSPDDTSTITIIANYIPFEKPDGGPNWFTFGENVRYEIHIKNDATTKGDDITYRFTFHVTNQDPTTFFRIRLGKENLHTTYTLEKSVNGGTFTTIVSNGVVPPPNIGPRSIDGAAGLNKSYSSIMKAAVNTATGSGGEKVFCGPVDDPFFVDLGGIFDLGAVRQGSAARDGLRKQNVHTIAMQIPIKTLQKSGKSTPASILDPEFVIGVWASASRPQITTLGSGTVATSGNYIQVSRLGMPLTNEAIIPVGMKDKWNATTPAGDSLFVKYFTNPELQLYMDQSAFATAVPAISDSLTIQSSSFTPLGNVNFQIAQKGLWVLKGTSYVKGTALDDAVFGTILLPDSMSPRAVDILPIFYTGVPNLAPYQLATGKAGRNPLAAGKPFINNFMPTLGDMLRLNMATPITDRSSKDFSSLGLVWTAVLGLTDSRYNGSTALQWIPNMDGFPNGRRLEDDVTRIEMQAVGGVVLAAIGLPFNDYNGTSKDTLSWPLSGKLLSNIRWTAGPTANDTSFTTGFPFESTPWRGYEGNSVTSTFTDSSITGIELGIAPPSAYFNNQPNPFSTNTTFLVHTTDLNQLTIRIYDMQGHLMSTVLNERRPAGTYSFNFDASKLPSGTYFGVLYSNGNVVQTARLIHTN